MQRRQVVVERGLVAGTRMYFFIIAVESNEQGFEFLHALPISEESWTFHGSRPAVCAPMGA